MNDSIIITKVANGWIVQLPLPVPQMGYINPEDAFRTQARIMREEFHQDDELARLRGETAETRPAPKKEPEEIPVVKHLHIFTDAEKMLAFLAGRLIKTIQ